MSFFDPGHRVVWFCEKLLDRAGTSWDALGSITCGQTLEQFCLSAVSHCDGNPLKLIDSIQTRIPVKWTAEDINRVCSFFGRSDCLAVSPKKVDRVVGTVKRKRVGLRIRLCDRLSALRKAAGLSIAEVASKTGFSPEVIEMLEDAEDPDGAKSLRFTLKFWDVVKGAPTLDFHSVALGRGVGESEELFVPELVPSENACEFLGAVTGAARSLTKLYPNASMSEYAAVVEIAKGQYCRHVRDRDAAAPHRGRLNRLDPFQLDEVELKRIMRVLRLEVH